MLLIQPKSGRYWPLWSDHRGDAMSSKALNWAFAQNLSPAALKLVLVAMADGADEYGVYWSGYTTLAKKTSLDRSTVIRHVDGLIKGGYIRKTRRFKYNGEDRSNLYCLNLGEVVAEDHPLVADCDSPPSSKLPPPSGKLQRPEPPLETINKKTALTREEFLREIDGQRIAGRFNAYTADESIIAIEAGNVWDYWAAYPDRKPTGDLVAGFIGWLRQSRAVKAAEKLAAKSKASGGSEGAPLAQASQPWHENIARKIGEAPARAWIYPLHHDGEKIIAPTKFHRDTVLQKFRTEIEAEFRRGIPIVFGQPSQEQSA